MKNFGELVESSRAKTGHEAWFRAARNSWRKHQSSTNHKDAILHKAAYHESMAQLHYEFHDHEGGDHHFKESEKLRSSFDRKGKEHHALTHHFNEFHRILNKYVSPPR